MSNEIRSAISRSESHSEIVRVAANCTTDNLRALLASIIECDWDMCDLDDNKVDVWGWTDETPENKMDWRLIVQCQPTAEEFCAEHAGRHYNELRDAIAAIDFSGCYPIVDADGTLTGDCIYDEDNDYSLCDIDESGNVRRHEHASDALVANELDDEPDDEYAAQQVTKVGNHTFCSGWTDGEAWCIMEG